MRKIKKKAAASKSNIRVREIMHERSEKEERRKLNQSFLKDVRGDKGLGYFKLDLLRLSESHRFNQQTRCI